MQRVINARVGPEGAELRVFASPSGWSLDELRSNKRPFPQPRSLRAVIDTGATITIIREGIAASLDMKPVNVLPISFPTDKDGKPALFRQYSIQLVLPNNVVLPQIRAAEMPMTHYAIDCLIGRDVLRQGVFIYNGPLDAFTLCL